VPQGEFIQHIVENIEPTVRAAKANGVQDIDEITALHVRDTINDLVSRSKVVREALESGKLAVVGANYKLVLGDIHPLVMLGQVTQ
jgi:carbonic anhydrase